MKIRLSFLITSHLQAGAAPAAQLQRLRVSFSTGRSRSLWLCRQPPRTATLAKSGLSNRPPPTAAEEDELSGSPRESSMRWRQAGHCCKSPVADTLGNGADCLNSQTPACVRGFINYGYSVLVCTSPALFPAALRHKLLDSGAWAGQSAGLSY